MASVNYTIELNWLHGACNGCRRRCCFPAVLEKASVEFKEWCRNSLARGAAGAHVFLRKTDELPEIHVTCNHKRRDGSDPSTPLSLRSEVWKTHLTKHGNDIRTDQLATAFRQARNEAVDFQTVHGHYFHRQTSCQSSAYYEI